MTARNSSSRKMQLYTLLVQTNSVDAVLNKMYEWYPEPEKQCTGMYGLLTATRNLAIQDQVFHNPEYERDIRSLNIQHPEDEMRRQIILNAPITKKYAVSQNRRRPYFLDPQLDASFKSIRPVKDIIYQLVLPSPLRLEAIKKRNGRLRVNANHGDTSRPSKYRLTHKQYKKIIRVATGTVEDCEPIKKRSEWCNMINSLNIVTGRRNMEILKSVTLEPVEGFPYQAICHGISKQAFSYERPVKIPLLCTYDQVINAWNECRKFYGDEISLGKTSAIVGSSEKLFGVKLCHTQKRNIYIEEAHRRRFQNQFSINEESCCRKYWTARALGTTLRDAEAYSLMLFDDNPENVDDQLQDDSKTQQDNVKSRHKQ